MIHVGTPISWTLIFSNLQITWSKSRFPLLSPNFPNYSIFQNQFPFPLEVKKNWDSTIGKLSNRCILIAYLLYSHFVAILRHCTALLVCTGDTQEPITSDGLLRYHIFSNRQFVLLFNITYAVIGVMGTQAWLPQNTSPDYLLQNTTLLYQK